MTKRGKASVNTEAKSDSASKKTSAGKFLSPENLRIFLYIILLAVIFIPTYNHIFDKKLAVLGDNAAYYILGTAIANGDGYAQVNIIDKPKASQFPPGYPAFMAGVMKIFNDKVTTLKKANGFLFFLSLVILFFFFRNISKNINLSFVITLALIFNMHLLYYSTLMMSEIPYIFISSLALLLMTMTDLKKKPWQDIYFPAMILAVAASYYVRGQGLAVLVAALIWLSFEKKWLHLFITLAGYAVLVGPWQLRNASLPESAYAKALKLKNYYDPSQGLMHFNDWIHRFFTNLDRYLRFEIPSALFGYQADYNDKNASLTAGIIIALVVLFAVWRLKKYRWMIAGYLLATFGILFLWPEIWNGIRFVLGLVPLLLFLFAYGIYSAFVVVAEKAKMKNTELIHKKLPFVFGLFLLVYSGKLDALHKAAKRPLDPLFRNYYAMAQWTKNSLPDTAVVICRKPNLFFVKSHHFVNGFSKVKGINKILETLDKKKTTHIVVYGDGITQRYFMPVYQTNPEKFLVVQQFRNPDVWLLEYKPERGYTGQWKDGKKEGHGSYVYPDGKKYVGS